jgi:endoglycosylceramidase
MIKSFRSSLFIKLLVTLLLFTGNPAGAQKQKRHFIHDDEGRALVLRGFNINSGAKHDSLRIGNTTLEDYKRLSDDWGLNFVRILVLWDGIEPEPGKYDTAYFARIRERLDWCSEAGLYAVVDMHQDLYSSKYGGDGAPDWAIREDGEEFEMQTPWEKNYLQPAVIASIRNFWMPENGHPDLQEHYIQSFKELAGFLEGHPALLGYDLYNEPVLATLELFSFEDKYLHPFYQTLINELRTVDQDAWLFYEPMAIGPNQSFRSGLNPLNDPREGEKRLVYFPHMYTLDLDITGKYMGCPMFVNKWKRRRRHETKKHGVPMLIGEFGLDNNHKRATKYLEKVMRVTEKIGTGWVYWDYGIGGSWNPVDKEGNEKPMLDVLVRPYPRKTAGILLEYGYKPKSGEFWLSYQPKDSIEGPTEIYIPERSYPGGWEFGEDAPEDNTWQWNEEERLLLFQAPEDEKIQRIIIIRKQD